MSENLHDTQFFQTVQENKMDVSQVLEVGYVMSGDPTYITSHKSARSLIMKVERDDILELLLSYYIKNKIDRR